MSNRGIDSLTFIVDKSILKFHKMCSKESRVKIFFHCSRFLSHTKNPHNHLQVKLHHAVSNYLHGPPSELTVPRHIYTRVERGVVEIPHVSEYKELRRPSETTAVASTSIANFWLAVTANVLTNLGTRYTKFHHQAMQPPYYISKVRG